jgi:hypothetical protein
VDAKLDHSVDVKGSAAIFIIGGRAVTLLFISFVASYSVCFVQTEESFFYVANTRPPDAYLSLRTDPTTTRGMNITQMPNGTLLELRAPI